MSRTDPMETSASPSTRRAAAHSALGRFAGPVAVALVLTLLNAVKPLHIDDSNYYQYAAHIAERPLDPYGFDVYWAPTPQPAYRILTPLLFPYWWAVAIRVVGEHPFLWKLWLFPFCFLFAYSLHTIFHRFARGLETPLLWMTALSPTVLPSLNLMLDIPALALSLWAFTLFLRAADRGSSTLAVLAGVAGGLAVLTKYTALTILPVIALYALTVQRVRLGLLATFLAVALFAAWESVVAHLYGHSHFLYHFGALGMSRVDRRVPSLILPLVGILGPVAPALALGGLVAVGASRQVILVGAAFGVIAYALLAYVPSHHATFMQDPVTAKARLTLNNLVVGALGLGFWGSVVTVAWQRCGSWREASRRLAARCGRAETRFLVLWLGIEVLGYFALSPYPAVRRVLGIVVAATALIGHAASVTCRGRARRLLLRGVVMGGIVLGLAYYVVDLVEATTEKAAAEEAARYVRSRDTHGTLWFVGFWGFQYYARRAGMQPAYPNLSVLKKGDWLVVPEERIAFQRVRSDDKALELVGQLSLEDRIPLSTKPAYYAGRSAIVHHEGPRVSVWVYRVTRDYIFASSW